MGHNSQLAATKDHYIPKRAGGKQIVICCRFCNNLKSGVSIQTWLEFMVSTPNWWQHHQTRACARFRQMWHHR